MAATVLCIFRFVRLLLGVHQAIALENAALRIQIAAYRREKSRPNLTDLDRWFWIALRQVWSNWRRALLYVQPDTVVRWQRERFRNFWARLSKPRERKRGRPMIPSEVRQLVARMATANPLWGAPRIHAELQLIGISLSERTVSRLLRRLPCPPSQNWKAFLQWQVFASTNVYYGSGFTNGLPDAQYPGNYLLQHTIIALTSTPDSTNFVSL